MLVKYNTTKNGFFCDKCKASVKEGDALYGCDQCNFDVCDDCWRSQKGTSSFPNQVSAQDTALGTMGANNTGDEVIYEGAGTPHARACVCACPGARCNRRADYARV